MAVAERRLKHWGWGHEDQQLDRAALEATAVAIHERLGFEVDEIEEPVPFDEIEVPKPRLKAPGGLGDLFSDDPHTRVSRALGKAYRDVVRGFRGEFENVPDLVAHPRVGRGRRRGPQLGGRPGRRGDPVRWRDQRRRRRRAAAAR